MILQLAEMSIGFTIGIAVMFGLAILMSFLTTKNTDSFFIFLTIFSGFIVWSGLLPLWVLIINLIVLSLVMIFKLKNRSQI